MKREFIETNVFRRLWVDGGLNEGDLHSLQKLLLEFPDAGDLIPGAYGLRKIRVAASGRGKRGGGRVFYKDFTFAGKIFFLFLILKKDSADLSSEQRKKVSTMLKEIEEDLYNG